ncbi:hypothetical protein KR018_004069 [Drosophila ironensis]|nr:hypothetical protein KR018_004069 [Drosophila ironensis]
MSCLPPLLLALLLLGLSSTSASDSKDPADGGVREKRATVTLDFGALLRNLLLKSAQVSAAKANINITPRPTRRPATTTTTTTAAPRRRKPFWHPYFASGYIPFDYDADYADPPAPPPPPPTPAPPVPQTTRRGRPQPRPIFYFGPRPVAPPAAPPATAAPPPPPPPPPPQQPPQQQQPLPYDYDYDYGAPNAPPPPPPPPPRPRPRPRPRPPQQQLQQLQPVTRRPTQLGDRLVYQYAQPTDTFSRPRVLGGGVDALAAAIDDGSDADAGTDADVDTGAGPSANAVASADDGATGAEPPPFLVNYANEGDFYSGSGPSNSQRGPPSAPGDVIPGSSFASLGNGFDNPNQQQQQQQQQQYFYK